MTANQLKERYTIYPTILREAKGTKIIFKTLVRKRYSGKYFLRLIQEEDNNESKCVHRLHSQVYRYLMLGEQDATQEILDDDQTNEVIRLQEKEEKLWEKK